MARVCIMDMYFSLQVFIPDISHLWAICIDPSMWYMHYISSLHCWNTLRNDKIKSLPWPGLSRASSPCWHREHRNSINQGYIWSCWCTLELHENDDPIDRVRKAALGSRKFTFTHTLWLSNIAMNNGTFIWLVVSTPLKNMSSPVGMMTFPTEWKS